MNSPSRSEIETLANEIFGADIERRIRDFAREETRALAQVRSTHNIGGYLPALVQCGAERLRVEILTLADAWVEAFTRLGALSEVWAEKALETAASQMAGGTVSRIRGQLDRKEIQTGSPMQDSVGHIEREIAASKNGALRVGKLRLKTQRLLPPLESNSARPTTSKPGREGFMNIARLMDSVGKPLTPEWSAAIESARSAIADLEAKSFPPVLKRMLRMAGGMKTSGEEFRSQLPTLLRELGLDIPAGVLQPLRGKAGRPLSTTTANIHTEWVRIGRPKITAAVCDRIARTFFGEELKKRSPGSAEHRKVRERVRQAIRRFEQRTAT